MENTKHCHVAKTIHEDEGFCQQHILAQTQSGLSKSRYCQLHTVDYARFIYWSRKAASAQVPASLVAVKLQSGDKRLSSDKVLGVLTLKKDCRLSIYDPQVLSVILERFS